MQALPTKEDDKRCTKMPNVSKSKYRKVSVGHLSIDRSGDVDQSKLPKTAATSPKKHSFPIVSWTMGNG